MPQNVGLRQAQIISAQVTADLYQDGNTYNVGGAPVNIGLEPASGTNFDAKPFGLIASSVTCNWYMKFLRNTTDPVCDTQYGGFMHGGTVFNIPLHPAVKTVSLCATASTFDVRMTWVRDRE